jgi:hypothetical protein
LGQFGKLVLPVIERSENVAKVRPRLWTINTRFPLLRFRSALHCGYSGITDIQDGLFFVLIRARTFKKS